jgi:hypothetical protein
LPAQNDPGDYMVEDPLPTPVPSEAMLGLLFGKQVTYALAAVARLGIADHMAHRPTSVDVLAEKAGAHSASLYRVMRMLASVGVFKQMGRRFALTPIGELLRTDHKQSARYRAMLRGDEWTTRSYEHFVDCIRTGTNGVSGSPGLNRDSWNRDPRRLVPKPGLRLRIDACRVRHQSFAAVSDEMRGA